MANSRIRFFTTDRWSTAPVCQASTSATGLPPAATQDYQRTSAWRSLAEAVPWVLVDLGSAQAVTAGALADLVVVSGTLSTIELQWSDNLSTWNTYTTLLPPFVNPDTRAAATYAASASHRYWLYRFFAASGTVVVQVGKAFVGTYLEATAKNFRIPMDLPLVDPSVVVPSLDGQRSVVRRTLFTTGTWKFEGIPEAQRDDLIAMLRSQRGPIFVAFYTEGLGTTNAGQPVGWGTMLQHIGPAQYPHTLNMNAANRTHYLIEIPFEEAR